MEDGGLKGAGACAFPVDNAIHQLPSFSVDAVIFQNFHGRAAHDSGIDGLDAQQAVQKCRCPAHNPVSGRKTLGVQSGIQPG